MSHQFLEGWTGKDVVECSDCRTLSDGSVSLCGWHENLVAATAAIDSMARSFSSPTPHPRHD